MQTPHKSSATTNDSNLSSCSGHGFRLCAIHLAALLAMALAFAATARAQSAQFQNSTLTGTTNTINVTNLPVVTSTGNIIYDNLTIPFSVADDGTLTVGAIAIVAATRTDTDGFFAGTCVGPSNDPNYIITISGPGVGSGGTTEWSLQAASGASGNTYPSTATWFVGPLKSNPNYPRLQADKITSTAYSYGTGGSSSDPGFDWGNNSLLGFVQTGNALSILSFTYDNTDSNTPFSEITYTCTPSGN